MIFGKTNSGHVKDVPTFERDLAHTPTRFGPLLENTGSNGLDRIYFSSNGSVSLLYAIGVFSPYLN